MKRTIIICMLVIMILAIGIVIHFLISNNNIPSKDLNRGTNENVSVSHKSIKEEIITKENYNQIFEDMKKGKLNENEMLYLSYSMMHYITKDGLAATFSGEDVEVASYKNIFNKKVSQLIDEGKQLMKENNVTPEQYKEQLKNMNK